MEEGKLRRIVQALDFDLAQYSIMSDKEYALIYDDWKYNHIKLNKLLRKKWSWMKVTKGV